MSKNISCKQKLLSRPTLVRKVAILKKQGKKIVMAGGFFDILHPGHTRYLEKARNLGDVLIVAINSDESTRKNKGPKRPINNEKTRAEILTALESVNYVTIFNELTPKEIIAEVKPDIWVKGGHYKKAEMPETAIIKQYGGKVKILPFEKGFSVSGLVEKIIKQKPVKISKKEGFWR